MTGRWGSVKTARIVYNININICIYMWFGGGRDKFPCLNKLSLIEF